MRALTEAGFRWISSRDGTSWRAFLKKRSSVALEGRDIFLAIAASCWGGTNDCIKRPVFAPGISGGREAGRGTDEEEDSMLAETNCA
jgi:hypothetical protein